MSGEDDQGYQDVPLDKVSYARSRSTRASHLSRNSKLPSITHSAQKQQIERDYT